MVLLVVSAPVYAATQSSLGFVTYSVSIDSMTGQHSAVVNETVSSSNKAGFADLFLQVIGQEQNLTYSRLVNSSTTVFPYLSAITSQSISYSNATMSRIHLNVTSGGTEQITFQGASFTLSVYSFKASGTYRNMTYSATGSVSAFPSGLVYSADLSLQSGYGIHAVLTATDLQLSSPQTQSATAAYVGLGTGVGAILLVGALLLRRGSHQGPAQKEKPIHWVD